MMYHYSLLYVLLAYIYNIMTYIRKPNLLANISYFFCQARPPILACSCSTCLTRQSSSCCLMASRSSSFSYQRRHFIPVSPSAALVARRGEDCWTWRRT